MSDTAHRSPVISRCRSCGGLVHPVEPEGAGWCPRCTRFVATSADGGDGVS